jgi:UDP-N-acetylmuramate dehydrogenase
MKHELEKMQDILFLENESLSNHSYLKIGGRAKYFLYPQSKEGLIKVLKFLKQCECPFLIIGQGSNILFPDENFNGVVLKINPKAHFLNFIEIENIYGKDFISVGAGTLKSDLLKFALEKSFSNFSFLAGIPGTVGGGLKMNAGTSNGSFSSVVKSIKTIDLNGREKIYKNTENFFEYRKLNLPSDEILVCALLYTTRGDKNKIRFEIDKINNLRIQKHPLDLPNCGSVFKNPPFAPAGILIERNNLKGFRIGGAEISQKHGNFIVNTGGATSEDFKKMIEHIKKVIYDKEKIELKEEVVIIKY